MYGLRATEIQLHQRLAVSWWWMQSPILFRVVGRNGEATFSRSSIGHPQSSPTDGVRGVPPRPHPSEWYGSTTTTEIQTVNALLLLIIRNEAQYISERPRVEVLKSVVYISAHQEKCILFGIQLKPNLIIEKCQDVYS